LRGNDYTAVVPVEAGTQETVVKSSVGGSIAS
jgi:hypothetical protein